MESFKRYINNRSNWRKEGQLRMVNQPEIVNYLVENPGKTENQIMNDIYGFDRGSSSDSNKKYADCLRRALYSRKIRRNRAVTSNGKRYIYFAI
tara:strand:+ start:26 stop:307 length:282 start_codon:yes stop_codon:yes gene_type:complete